MIFQPESRVVLNINGREFYLCPEQRGQRYCFRLDGGRPANIKDGAEQREVLHAIEDVFRGEGQPVPSVTFTKMIPSVTFGEAFGPAFDAMKRARAEWERTTEGRAELEGKFRIRRGTGVGTGGGTVVVPGERTLVYCFWFFDDETQNIVRFAIDSLRQRATAMRAAGCAERHVAQVGVWRTVRTLVPIFWDGSKRLSKRLPVVGAALRALDAFLRKVDPPRLG